MIYTVGHSNHTIDYFIEIIKEFGIDTIVEIRSVPNSKYLKHFNKSNLINELSKHNIKYLDMSKYLGGRPEDKSVLNIDNKIELHKIEGKNWYQEAIDRLVNISKKSRIAIMCSEENPANCHRGYIISHTLLNRGEEIIHIRGNKIQEKAKFYHRQIGIEF